jgi:hypothetical protein
MNGQKPKTAHAHGCWGPKPKTVTPKAQYNTHLQGRSHHASHLRRYTTTVGAGGGAALAMAPANLV